MKKKLIGYGIACVVIAVIVVLAIKFGRTQDIASEPMKAYRFDSDISTDPQTLDNGIVSLVFNPVTCTFTFKDKYGNEWTSIPNGAEEGTRTLVQSLLYIEYQDENGVKNYLDSRDYSTNKGNYTYEKVDDTTIRIDYSIGKMAKEYTIPSVMSETRYEEIKAMLQTPEAQKCLRDWYKCYDPEKLKNDEKKYNDAVKLYPDLEKGIKVYAIFDNLKDWQKEKLETIFAEELGYTDKDKEADDAYGKQEGKQELLANVNLSLYLKLDGEDLIAEIPYDSIQFYKEYPITSIQILPFMCSAGMDEEGFLFVPDGSGAYITLNNGKTTQPVYSARVYGWDYGQNREILISDPVTRFPIYGISLENRNASLLALIEDGDAYASIEADVAGKVHDYNYVTNVFSIVHNQVADIAGGRSLTSFYIYEDSLPKGEKISVRYRATNSSDYVDMAKTYREYFTARYPEVAQTTSKTSVPVAVELLGAVTKVQHVLGFPKDLPYALTTYSEMEAILKDLHDSGWTDVNVVLNGWFNEGITHDWPDDIDLIGKLGKKKDLKKLLATAKSYGYNVAGKADFTFVYNDSLLDGFYAKFDAARYVTREVVEFQDFSKIWYGIDEESDKYYLAKPSYSMDALESYLKDAKKLGINGIAFSSIGNKLGADYYRKSRVSRVQVMQMQVEQLAKLKDNGNVVYEGNAYALPYADIVLNFPLRADKASIEDGVLPFFPIALHGYVRYTGDSVNITNDYITNLLKSVESGAGLYFIFMDADASELEESDHTEYFGANYDSWKDEAKALYDQYVRDFGDLANVTIEDHQMLADNVSLTEYANGTKVYVNYRTTDYTYNGITVPAQNWYVEKGGN